MHVYETAVISTFHGWSVDIIVAGIAWLARKPYRKMLIFDWGRGVGGKEMASKYFY